MTKTETPAAKIGDTAWYLTKILHIEGGCDHCGRSLKHLYAVVNPNGQEMTVGRRCVKKITGWTLSCAQAEQALRSAKRCAEMAQRRAAVAEDYPELIDAEAQVNAACDAARADGFDPMCGYARVPAEVINRSNLLSMVITTDCWWGERGWSDCATWQEYLTNQRRWA